MNIKEIFETMEYGPAPESDAEARAWLADRGGIAGPFINGKWGPLRADFATSNPATGEKLAGVTQATKTEVAQAVKAARKAQPAWAKSGHARARVLYAIARGLQKHSRLLAVMETLDTGKPIRESRDIDIPLAQRHFYYHAGMAQLMASALPDRAPLGVCGQIIPWNFPLLMLAWKIAPALAMGNTVVLKPAEYTPLTAMIFAEICETAGVPLGVVNIVTGDGAVGEMIVEAEVDKIAFTGSTDVGRKIRAATAGSGKSLTLELGGKSPYIVFDDADLDSAVEGLVDAIWFNQGQVCCAGSRLLVQEGIAEQFYTKLRTRMEGLRVGDPRDKCIDIGAVVDPVQLAAITALVDGNSDGEMFQTSLPETCAAQGCFYPPTLITGLHSASPLMQDEIFGPVLVSTTFRTPAEAIALANNTRYGLAASLWTENINLAFEIAPKLVCGVTWVNATNLFDAAAGFGGVRESGFGREGGWEGLSGYTKCKTPPQKSVQIVPFGPKTTSATSQTDAALDRTTKLYIGGKQTRPDSGYSRAVYDPKGRLLGEVSLANRKDLRNAVEAANAARGWSSSTAHLRAQVLYYIAENLSSRAGDIAEKLKSMTGKSGVAEVEASLDALFTFAAWADKYDGDIHSVPIRGVALAMKEPVGTICMLCPDATPLLGLLRPLAAALAMGNRVICTASQPFPLITAEIIQLIETSDIPGGVVNLLTGDHTELAPHMAAHGDVDAVWSFSPTAPAIEIERGSISNLKRIWISDTPSDPDLLRAASDVKNIWVPYGE